MRTLARIVLALGIAAGGVIGAAYLLPQGTEIRAAREISATPGQVYAVAADLRRFDEWSQWPEFGADVLTTLSGSAGAEGQTLSWVNSDRTRGLGMLTLTSLAPERRVNAAIILGDTDEAMTILAIDPVPGGSRVAWVFAADLGSNPLNRYLWVLSGARARLESQLAAGLDGLAVLADSAPPLAPPAIIATPVEAPVFMPPIASSPLPVLTPFASGGI